MEDNTLIKTALVVAVLGIMLLYFISGSLSIDEAAISRLSEENIDEQLKIKGKLLDVKNKGNLTLLKIEKPETIDVVIFDNISVKADSNVEVIGKLAEYKGKYEIIADRIELVG